MLAITNGISVILWQGRETMAIMSEVVAMDGYVDFIWTSLGFCLSIIDEVTGAFQNYSEHQQFLQVLETMAGGYGLLS